MINPCTQIRGNGRRLKVSACILSVALLSLAWRNHSETPRAWAAQDVPVAFWAWRNEMPGEAEVGRAKSEARAQALFLRAGQFDLARGKLARIRPGRGKFPHALPLHLVYNATRGLLAEFERVEENALASVVAETFRQDVERAAGDGASVAGLQLDFDVPTRLLPRYARVLRGVRGGLPPRTQLSITGLPTWMESATPGQTLGQTLDAVNFWIPQCYGATIPERIEAVDPISSPESVALAVARARKLGRPFYAGLAAYGYAILYDAQGALVELRGDLDPAGVARDANFELIERRPFPAAPAAAAVESTSADSSAATPREWRYVYRALDDGLVENMPVRAGDRLLLDVPSAETLRASARAARTEGGARLLGLCLFRLPGDAETNTLTLPQITAALNDAPADIATDVRFESDDRAAYDARHLRIKATNSGAAGALFGADALTLTLQVPAGSVNGVVSLENISAVESFCGGAARELRPCSLRRADTLRLRAQAWQPGATAGAVLSFTDGHPPAQLSVQLAVRADDGRLWQSSRQLTTQRDERR